MVSTNRPEVAVDLWTDANLHAQWQQASSDLEQLVRENAADHRETGEAAAVVDARAHVRDLEAQALGSLLVFTIRALPRKRLTELEEEHPPREGNKNDEFTGVNLSTFIDAVLSEPGAIVSVTHKTNGEAEPFDGPAEWMALADEMSNGQWEAFVTPVLTVNRGTVSPGFNRAAWQTTRS
ncbi:MAG: hypothetical protein FWF90_11385 [Promicromonosporaceae bacterium]|nr:hypothetical protein [Promicromonosporaceae bacterium]